MKRNLSGINPNPIEFVPGDLILTEDIRGRNIFVFLHWLNLTAGHALVVGKFGPEETRFNPEAKYELYWVVQSGPGE